MMDVDYDKKLKNVELAKKLLPIFNAITVLGILGLCYCAYKLFFFEYRYMDGTPFVYAIYALIIGIVIGPIATLGLVIEEKLKKEQTS